MIYMYIKYLKCWIINLEKYDFVFFATKNTRDMSSNIILNYFIKLKLYVILIAYMYLKFLFKIETMYSMQS